MINEIVIQNLKTLENLTLEKRDLEAQIEALKQVVIEQVPRDAQIKTDNGTFTVESRKKWNYSEAVKRADAALKETKKHEEANGDATYTEGEPYLVYRENKD